MFKLIIIFQQLIVIKDRVYIITNKILGIGSYGYVYLGCNAKTQGKCAIKVIHKTQLTMAMAVQQKLEY